MSIFLPYCQHDILILKSLGYYYLSEMAMVSQYIEARTERKLRLHQARGRSWRNEYTYLMTVDGETMGRIGIQIFSHCYRYSNSLADLLMMSLINEACIKQRRTQTFEILLINDWTGHKKIYLTRRWGDNNSDHECT